MDNAFCWLRNFDRKSWAVTIPYEQGGEFKELYPDFLFVRSNKGELIIDILDPHHTNLADAPAKAVGLAKYVAKHAHMFGRIELIIIDNGKIKRLDLKTEKIRNKVSCCNKRTS